MFSKKPDKINIDELYEHHRVAGEKRIAMYNTILGQIHARIKHANRTTNNMDITYKIPMMVFGETVYKYQDCVEYIVQQLTANGFTVETQRNLIFISWKNWIPSFIRTNLKKKGIYVDALGNPLPDPTASLDLPTNEPAIPPSSASGTSTSRYKPITAYRPTRSVIYDEELLRQTEQRLMEEKRSK